MALKNPSAKCSILFIICSILVLQSSANYASQINNYIRSLKFNPDEVLAYQAPGVNSIPREGRLDDKKTFIVITREKKSVNNGKADIGVLTTNQHRTYPGSLLLANSHLIDNIPDTLPIGRGLMEYTVNLPGLSKADGSFKIAPNYADYQASLNNVLKKWFENYGNDHNVNAIFQEEYAFAYSKDQLRVKFGMEFKNTDVEANIDFESINNNKKTVMVTKFKQIFYTVSVPSARSPADLFDSTVTLDEVKQKINARNPPVLVDSVSYGRTIYIKIETSSTDMKAKSTLETHFSSISSGASSEIDYSKELKDFSMQVYVMGGGSEHIELVNAKTLKDVNEIIVKLSKFSRDNLGYPLSYSSEFINDNGRATINGLAEYTETTRTEYESGLIVLEHTGGYIAKFILHWDEVEIDRYGNEVVHRRGWEKNEEHLTAGFYTEIPLSGNCRNIAVQAWEVTGLAWEWWRKIIDRTGIPLIKKRIISIWGTTLVPATSINPENDI